MTTRLFGTDGIRGTAGTFPLDVETIRRVGAALAGVAVLVGGVRVGTVTVGLQVTHGDGPVDETGQTLVVPWDSGETRITQETCPGLGTLPTSRR